VREARGAPAREALLRAKPAGGRPGQRPGERQPRRVRTHPPPDPRHRAPPRARAPRGGGEGVGAQPYRIFERKLLQGIRVLHKLANAPLDPEKHRLGHSPYLRREHLRAAFRFLPADRPYTQRLRDLVLTFRHAREWLKLPDEERKDFTFTTLLFAHGESPLSLVVMKRYPDGKPLAIGTVGFRLLRSPEGRPVLAINNIQGEYRSALELEALSKELGESWRLHLVRRLIDHARKKGFGVEGELPRPYYEEWPHLAAEAPERRHKKEWQRQVRVYKQTYRKLGFKERGGRWVLEG
jgi:hypothetical protein